MTGKFAGSNSAGLSEAADRWDGSRLTPKELYQGQRDGSRRADS